MMNDKIDIKPGVAMLGILKHIEYDHWYAIAEFVDNSIDSFIKNEKRIKEREGEDFKFVVSIEININDSIIRIKDNAAGIDEANYQRAFKPAERPPDASGLSEFGMGMKSAACWYSDQWSVKTSALGETTEKTVVFDMGKIFHDKIEELEVLTQKVPADNHYTIIELTEVNRMPVSQTIKKIKNHLASIYREFIRKEIIILKFNKEVLTYTEPILLTAPKHNDINGKSMLWRKDIDFDIDKNLRVHGFVGILKKGSTTEAGFALFRRGRVILGSYDQTFRPVNIFKNPNSFRYQRIIGELHLDGFEVSFSKRGFQADENMQIFLELLENDIQNFLEQADNFRAKATESEIRQTAEYVLKSTIGEISRNAKDVIGNIRNLPKVTETVSELVYTDKSNNRTLIVDFNDSSWEINIELSYDPSIVNFYEVGDHLISPDTERNNKIRRVGIRLSLAHPFMQQFIGIDKSRLEPMLRVVAALGLSETIARSVNATNQGEIRRNFNQLIKRLLTPQS
ncbi:ATP-binding protein [Siphonobacter sp. SORGH_AS_1065]|uniref:ATP-binding protein n=1 Tax=Siphonobacter sp. SORGH_AS_1065 TaxID=3041795 RepID=UPI002787E34D|nr:ATP-binding protein [Siphonobacter sp. SORGH_AS_1065]MDQ1088617.1 hypothetical protein [Siphonobacter sp. SORGH_AS_1065]